MTLIEKMEMLAGLMKQVETLKAEVEAEVKQTEQSQQSQHLAARYTTAKRTYDYKGLSEHLVAPQTLIDAMTVPKTDWRKVVKAMSPTEGLMEQFATYGKPSVSIKLLEG